MSTYRKKATVGDNILRFVSYTFVIGYCLIVLLPFWHVLMDSVSGRGVKLGARFWPEDFSLQAYHDVLSQNKLLGYYGNTIYRTVFGTLLCVAVTFLTAYPLSKSSLPFGRFITYLIVFTMYFSSGLIPQFLLYRDLGLQNNRLVLILPKAFSGYYILITRNFIANIPPAMDESARLDGANDITIAFKVYLPLLLPIIATITLWSAVELWNEWFTAMIYITDSSKQVMQVMLRRLLMEAQLAAMYDDDVTIIQQTEDAIKAVTIIITILPIICVYPFAQKYFVAGLTSGAVKE